MLGQDFRFNVGSVVHFGRGQFHQVQWRGWLLVGEAGRRYRADVYWLGGDTWDCYYGDQLWSIGQHPF